MGFVSIKLSYISGVSSDFLHLLLFYKKFPEYRQDSWYIKAAVSYPEVTPGLSAKGYVQVMIVVTFGIIQLFLAATCGEFAIHIDQAVLCEDCLFSSLLLHHYELSVR